MPTSKISTNHFNKAVNAYNKALTNNKAIAPSKEQQQIAQPLNVLRAGDVIDVVSKQSASFSGLVSEIVAPQIKKIQEGEKKSTKVINSKEDLVEVAAALNKAEGALHLLVTVRDKVINAYQEILKMPL
ncbi:flagellar hook-basal body protein FliE [endosymbiont of Acanthamoeba sp. UWC8]|uniref:flagellar hook-basal body complex protein FliE n=1 Tax=endosymbiont of Acanthamoeba sp. UWC8 TaxID=86106 RepID=UPI0004D16EAB|nr:flagellar hook-basal body complex protein FliE [endosymbiont of Acanthamoeba sp. UWC8]AIF81545.1 flagellar hook-basal body protein FliE [endosymbiont of Acanthamoeba sp. UWC8]